jgi:hypothetical protein
MLNITFPVGLKRRMQTSRHFLKRSEFSLSWKIISKEGYVPPPLGMARAAGPRPSCPESQVHVSRPWAAEPTELRKRETAQERDSSCPFRDTQTHSLSPERPTLSPIHYLHLSFEIDNICQTHQEIRFTKKSPFLVISRRYSIFTIFVSNYFMILYTIYSIARIFSCTIK